MLLNNKRLCNIFFVTARGDKASLCYRIALLTGKPKNSDVCAVCKRCLFVRLLRIVFALSAHVTRKNMQNVSISSIKKCCSNINDPIIKVLNQKFAN